MTMTAATIMTSPPITVGPRSSVRDIAALLVRHDIGAVPVVDDGGALIGLVSEADLIRPLRESARAKREWWLDMLAAGESLAPEFLNLMRSDARSAADCMAHVVVTADEAATLPQLAELMVARHVRRLPIVRGHTVVGMVSRSDLIRAMVRAPAMLA